MICSLFYDDSSVEPLRSHPVRHAFLGTQMPSGPSSEVYILDPWVWFCYGFGWPGLHVWWCMIWCHLIFPTHHTFDAILGHIFALDWDLQILTFAWSSLVTRYMSGWGFCFTSSWLFQWICPWVISSGSHFSMLMWFSDGVVSGSWILASSFCRVHVRFSVRSHWRP